MSDQFRLMLKSLRQIVLPMLIPILILGLSIGIIQRELDSKQQARKELIMEQNISKIEDVFNNANLIGSYFDVNAKYMQVLKKILNRPVNFENSETDLIEISNIKKPVYLPTKTAIFIFILFIYIRKTDTIIILRLTVW